VVLRGPRDEYSARIFVARAVVAPVELSCVAVRNELKSTPYWVPKVMGKS